MGEYYLEKLESRGKYKESENMENVMEKYEKTGKCGKSEKKIGKV